MSTVTRRRQDHAAPRAMRCARFAPLSGVAPLTRAARLTRAALLAGVALLGATAPLLAQAPDAVWPGTFAGDAFGTVVAAVGDVDGDGVPDMAYGSPTADRLITQPFTLLLPDVGRVIVRSGATGAVLHDWYGSVSGEQFGFSVAGAGDVSGDDRADVLIGIPNTTDFLPTQGAVQLRSGGSGVVLRMHFGTQAGERFGHSVIGGGRFDDDFVGDYAVGAPLHDKDDDQGGFGQEGAVYVFSGDSGAPITGYVGGYGPVVDTVFGVDADVRHLGWSLDARDTALVMGAPLTDTLHQGSTLVPDTGLVRYVEVALGTLRQHVGEQGSRAGTTVALGDAVPGGPFEVAFGAPNWGDGGYVQVRTPGTVAPAFAWSEHVTLQGTAAEKLGTVLAFVGDVDGDNFEDVAVGLPLADVGSPFSLTDAGRLRVHRVTDGAVVAAYAGNSTGDRFGSAVAGFVTSGGGHVDLLVGVPGDDTGNSDVGAAWYFDANPCHAGQSTYGAGWPGTLGVPGIEWIEQPVLGANTGLLADNSLGQPTSAWIVLGFAPASVPFKDGTLLVSALKFKQVPMGVTGIALPVTLPDDAALCGVHAYLQVLVVDPGASRGVAFTPGLELALGY